MDEDELNEEYIINSGNLLTEFFKLNEFNASQALSTIATWMINMFRHAEVPRDLVDVFIKSLDDIQDSLNE